VRRALICSAHPKTLFVLHSREAIVTRGYVLGPSEGEHLILRGGSIFITANPGRASDSIAMGTQQVPVGVGIPVHRHFEMGRSLLRYRW
jgi:hypothetical protein